MSTKPATPFNLAGLQPATVLEPATAADLAEALAAADRDGQAVTPWGGGTQQRLGKPPERYDVAVRTTRLDRVLQYAPNDMTVRVEGGITLGELQATVGRQGQYVAIDAPLPDQATVGGILAAAGSGPRRLGYGERRDQVIGIGVAHPDGAITHSGGSVVKNVTGYDMGKLHIGSLGTLGVIVEATFRLRPFPAQTGTVVARFDSRDAALRAISAVRLSPLQPLALDLLSRAAGEDGGETLWTVAVEFGGVGSAVVRELKDARGLLADGEPSTLDGDDAAGFWANVRDFGRSADDPHIILRAAVLPTKLGQVLDALAAAGAAAEAPAPTTISRAGNGMVFAHWPDEDLVGNPLRWAGLVADLRRRVARLGGSLVVEDAPPELAEAADVWGPTADNFPIMQRLKREFDPHHVLNPGRFVGGL